jgi:hypothetical protein
MSIGFATRDGTVLPAHEVALGIYLLMLNEPKLIFDRIWKFIEPNIPTDRRAQFEANFLDRMQLYSEAATLRVLIKTKDNDERQQPPIRCLLLTQSGHGEPHHELTPCPLRRQGPQLPQ